MNFALSDLPHIFERFYRGSDKPRIISLHGGTIEVSSTPERGTIFSFTLPSWQADNSAAISSI